MIQFNPSDDIGKPGRCPHGISLVANPAGGWAGLPIKDRCQKCREVGGIVKKNFFCAGCDVLMIPGNGRSFYSGRTGQFACDECVEPQFVPLTKDLAAALRGEREWTQEDENHVTGVKW